MPHDCAIFPFIKMHFKWVIFLLVSIFSVLVVSLSISSFVNSSESKASVETTPTVYTPEGKYVGRLDTNSDGTKIIKYLGIRFAQPPLGELRFKRPQPPKKGTPYTIINAEHAGKSCISVTKKSTSPYYSEDCLSLNIYIPGNRSTSEVKGQNVPYSVMIWLHPGGFVAGSTNREPTKLVTRGNVIVVMVNYRMGVLGFLTTNDDALPGNNGLWDQYMAIKWVKDNIGHFGGDVNSITVFGESAGSMSAHILALSPVPKNIFQKVILQSGTASSVISRDYIHFAHTFGQMVGCSDVSDHSKLAICLRNISITEILMHDRPQNFKMSFARRQADFIWVPIVDGEMIPDDPAKLHKNVSYLKSIGAFNKDYMIGVLDNEGGLIPQNFINHIPLSDLQDTTFYSDLLDYYFHTKYGLRADETLPLKKTVNNFYFGSQNVSFPLSVQAVLDTISDAMFVSSAIDTARAISVCNKTAPPLCQGTTLQYASESPLFCSTATAKVFFYLFDYCPPRDICTVRCMSHGSDFAYEFPKGDFSDQESNQMSDIFVDLLTTFAKTSNPGTAVQSGWPTFEPYNQYYLRLSPQPSLRQNVYEYRTRLWLDTIPKMVESVVKDNKHNN